MNNETLTTTAQTDSEALLPQYRLPLEREEILALLKASPMQYWDNLDPRHTADVFDYLNINGLTFSVLREIEGETRLNAMMVKWMAGFLRFFSVCTMDADQAAETIKLILEEYPYFCIPDLKLFFKQAKKGAFGEIYGRFDGSVILNWLRKYSKLRRDSFDGFQRQRKMDSHNLSTAKWQEYIRSPDFEKNKANAQKGFQALQERINNSKFGPQGNRISRL